MSHKEIIIDTQDQIAALKDLEKRTDAEAIREKRYLAMPDLSRTPESPLYEIVARARATNALKNLDNIVIPEVVPASITFDLFDFPADHPARSKSDTYYVNDKNILRTHPIIWMIFIKFYKTSNVVFVVKHIPFTIPLPSTT
jgi:phenylalanyl-tRNA synthetase alpha chain